MEDVSFVAQTFDRVVLVPACGQLRADSADVRGNDVRRVSVVVSPGLGDEQVLRDDAVDVAHQAFEDGEFDLGQQDRARVAGAGAGDGVERDAMRAERTIRGVQESTVEGVDVRLEFGHVAGLGQIGVSAEVEPRDAVVGRAERTDDDHRGFDAGGSGFADDVASVFAGKHEVDDGEIVLVSSEMTESDTAVLCGSAEIAQLGQSPAEELPLGVVVFDYQRGHAVIIA